MLVAYSRSLHDKYQMLGYASNLMTLVQGLRVF